MYEMNYIDGKRMPPMIINEDYVLVGEHCGTIHVEAGTLVIQGKNSGTLDVQMGAKVEVLGEQSGSTHIATGAEAIVRGIMSGSTTISDGSTIIVEEKGMLSGSVRNEGILIIKGVFGGARLGDGEIIIEGNGYIKEPVTRNGMTYYQW